MDYVRAALLNAAVEGMTIQDLYAMAEHATTCESFDRAVNTLSDAMPFSYVSNTTN